MVNEPKGLWLPREVLIAQEIASSEEPQMSMIFEKSPFLIHSCALYFNALDESLLCQTVLMTTNHRLFLRRAVGWDMDQPHGSGSGADGGK